MPSVSAVGTLPLAARRTDPQTPVAVSPLAFSRSVQEPQTRITPPLRRTPPGQQRGHPPSSSRGQIRSPVSMPSQPVFDASTATPDPSINPDRAILERLPGPHLTRSTPRLFPGRSPRQSSANAAPGRFDACPRRTDAGGPAILHLSHSTAYFRGRSYISPPSAFVTHGPPGSRDRRFRTCTGSSTPRGSPTARESADDDVAFRFIGRVWLF